MKTNIEILNYLAELPDNERRILEIGTRRVTPDRPSHRKAIFKNYKEYVMSDFEEGTDVDIVADAESLTKVFKKNEFDLVLAFSTLEHIKHVWLAANEIHKILKPGGIVFVQTHQTFPIHAYPHDYWRFTTEALKTLFPESKFDDVVADYNYPCEITSEQNGSSKGHQAFLNVNLSAIKK